MSPTKPLPLARPLVLVWMSLSGCAPAGHNLYVDLKSDLAGGVEFTTVRTELFLARHRDRVQDRTIAVDATLDQRFDLGIRIAEFRQLNAGPHFVHVELLDGHDDRVAYETAAIEIRGNTSVTVLIARNCPNGECATSTCSDDAQCSSVASCAVGKCEEGVCLAFPDRSQCGTDEWCHPDVGCSPVPVVPDAGEDVGVDSDTEDSGDGGTGPDVPDAAVECEMGFEAIEGVCMRTWTQGRVEYGGTKGLYSAMFIDFAGRRNVVYDVGSSLQYAFLTPSPIIMPFDNESSNYGKYVSAATDYGARAHLAYSIAGTPATNGVGAVRYLAYTYSSDVETAIVDDVVDTAVGSHASIATGDGRVGISYYDETNRKVKLAERDDEPGSAWEINDVTDGVLDAGPYSSVALGSAGYADVAFYEDGVLRVANHEYYFGPFFSYYTIDDSADVGRYVTLVIGDNFPGFCCLNTRRVAYYDKTNGDLKYAVNSSGVSSWSIQVVDEVGDVGLYPAMVQSPDGWMHIVYYDATHGDLKYARQTGPTDWVIQVIDAEGDVGIEPSVTIDSSGLLHVSYRDNTSTPNTQGLKYAHQ